MMFRQAQIRSPKDRERIRDQSPDDIRIIAGPFHAPIQGGGFVSTLRRQKNMSAIRK
jgi:hypothetical protein